MIGVINRYWGPKWTPVILFAIKSILVYYGLIYLFNAYWGLCDVGGFLDMSDTVGKYNVLNYARHWIVSASAYMLGLLGYPIELGDFQVRIVGSGGVIMGVSCIGFSGIAVLIAFLFSYPEKSTTALKVVYFTGCVFVMEVLNVIRVTLLAIVNKKNPEVSLAHHEMYNIVIYIFLFFAIYYWSHLTKDKFKEILKYQIF